MHSKKQTMNSNLQSIDDVASEDFSFVFDGLFEIEESSSDVKSFFNIILV